MNRINPNFRNATLSDEEANDFINELFDNLFDADDINSDCDKTPNLVEFDR